ncbi:MAG: MFS transporter [Zestosphaera tikiterensis]|uniref:Lysosomal dipeptide transporter MFSD1 n=1 Tax=Zestosphaera tikiterensis TaxID=1973259 RepID=A0A2R7Y111_9CREN|nr:MAG: MFS transporter [Zestosphaera tikiterensis]
MSRLRGSTSVIVVLLIAYMLVYFHRTMTGVMKPEIDYYSRYYGVDANLMLAVMSSAYFYAYVVGQFFMGPIVDYYGVKKAGSLMVAILGVATLMVSLPNTIALVVGRALIGLSASIVFLSYMRSSALEFTLGKQGKLTSYALFAGNVSTILATYPLRLMLNSVGLPLTLIALALSTFAISASIYVASRDVGRRGSGMSVVEQAMFLGRIARNPHSWGVGLAAAASYGIGLAYQSSWGQIHLTEVFSLSKEDVSTYLMVLAMVFALTSLPTGYLSDRLKRRKPFLLTANVIAVIAWFLMYVSSIEGDKLLLTASLILVGLSQGVHVVAPTMAKELYDPKISGTAVAFFNIVLFTSIALLQSICPLLNPLTALAVNIAIALIGIAITTLLVKETYRIQH